MNFADVPPRSARVTMAIRKPRSSPFPMNAPRANTLRLAFVTVPPERIRAGVEILGRLLRERVANAVSA